MASATDQEQAGEVAAKFQRGDLAGARADCLRYFAEVTDPVRQAPLRYWLGVIEQRTGSYDAAVAQFELALAGNRRQAPWLFQAGLAHYQLNALDRAEYLYRQALRIDPRYALAHYNLGVVLQHKQDKTGARRAFETALVHQPRFPEALVNLANLLIDSGDIDSAEENYRRALDINPGLANAHYGLGLLHLREQRHAQAARCFESAVDREPTHAEAWLDLAECHQRAGDDARSIACLEQVLAHAPAASSAHATAQFKLANRRGDQPAAVPQAMVERLYATMAATFDEHLATRLDYHIPGLLIDELSPWLNGFVSRHAHQPAVLDLGCGTGLFGGQVRAFAGRLVGVDLSAAMLARARAQKLYDELQKNDIEAYFSGTEETFDLITATDVLIYLGRLDELFAQVAAHLTSGGRFAFSIETPSGLEQDFFLLPTGRFAHHTRYVERLAGANALLVMSRIDTTIRTENGVPLAGYLFIFQKS